MSRCVLTRLIHSCLCSLFLSVAWPAAAQSFSASGAPWFVPDAPATGSQCGNFTGTDIGIPITVSGINRPITDIGVSITFPTAQNWGGDLNAILVAPNGASQIIFGRIGATTLTHCGDASNWSGTYTFVDPTVSSNNIWTAASTVGDTVAIPPGIYMTTPRGGDGVSNPPAGTPFIATFANLSPAQINGQWTLRLRDTGQMGLITVNAVTLTLPNCYDIDGNGQNNPLIDGLITLRAQMGLSGAAVTGGITFPNNAMRTTWPALRAFMVDSCGMMGVAA